MVTIIFLVRAFKIYSLSTCQICNTVMLSTVTVLYCLKRGKKPAEKYFWKNIYSKRALKAYIVDCFS